MLSAVFVIIYTHPPPFKVISPCGERKRIAASGFALLAITYTKITIFRHSKSCSTRAAFCIVHLSMLIRLVCLNLRFSFSFCFFFCFLFASEKKEKKKI